jgi:hypothetical protein
MFKKSKWEAWYDAQPDHIKKWIDEPRPIWYDSDMWRAGLFGVVVGLMIGLII